MFKLMMVKQMFNKDKKTYKCYGIIKVAYFFFFSCEGGASSARDGSIL
jgi:hypothetical protein